MGHSISNNQELSVLKITEDLPATTVLLPKAKKITQKEKLIQRTKNTLSCNTLLDLLPILRWLPHYNVKENLVWDVIAGLTVSVLQIPHGLAFAPLGGQAPVVGLYMAIFPVLMYVCLGTSRHLSLGMQAILVIMVGKVVETHTQNGTYTALEVGIACTFTIGLWQILLACLQLGSLCVLLSNSLVSGLTTAAAVHITFFQLKHVFGVSLVMASGPLKLIYASIDLIENLPETNLVVFALSSTVVVILIIFNFFLKPIIAKKSRYPIPMEFLLICVSVGVSYALDLRSLYNVAVVGEVPNGLPSPMVPPFALIPSIAMDCFIIALVNLSINISVAKVFAKKGNYDIRENQELLAYGTGNVFGGFFQSLPVCTALSRSMIQFSVGGKTEMTHLICVVSVLLMLLFLGPFFELVPLCVLAAIVIVTMIPLLMQVKDFPEIWRRSRQDGFIWLVTFFFVIFVDLDYGIGAGLLTTIFVLLISANKSVLKSKKFDNIFIMEIHGSFNFVNSAKLFKRASKEFSAVFLGEQLNVILDLSRVVYTDPTGISELLGFYKVVSGKECTLFITNCCDSVYEMMENCKFFDSFDRDFVVPDVESAKNSISGL